MYTELRKQWHDTRGTQTIDLAIEYISELERLIAGQQSELSDYAKNVTELRRENQILKEELETVGCSGSTNEWSV